MSVSPTIARTTQIQNIPTKRMIITDVNQLPQDYSSTPGGTLYSTTPGGSRIMYDRTFLLNLKNSPMSQTPPKTGVIPDFLLRGGSGISPVRSSPPRSIQTVDEEQFVMDL